MSLASTLWKAIADMYILRVATVPEFEHPDFNARSSTPQNNTRFLRICDNIHFEETSSKAVECDLGRMTSPTHSGCFSR